MTPKKERKCDCGALVWCYIDGYIAPSPRLTMAQREHTLPKVATATDVASDDSEGHTQCTTPDDEPADHVWSVELPSLPIEPTPEPVQIGVAVKQAIAENDAPESHPDGPILTLSENRGLQVVDSNGVGKSEEAENAEVRTSAHPTPSRCSDRVNGLSVRKPRRRSRWSGYARPAAPAAPKIEYGAPERPFPPRARTLRRSPVQRKDTVPAYVKEAKIAEQFGRCVYCQRKFGSAVLHNGKVEILSPQQEHVKPRAAKGRTSDSNIGYACHVCNALKSDFLFASVEEIVTFLKSEWERKQYTDGPPLLPFQRDTTIRAGMYN